MSDLIPNRDRPLQEPHADDEIDLKEVFMVLWAGKWFISAVTGLAAAFSVTFALSTPNIYTASALLAPAESGGGGLGGLMKQYSGLASLAGVPLPAGQESSRAQLGMQLMRSRAFISAFVERRDILPELMAARSWEPETGELQFDPDLYDNVNRIWLTDEASGESSKPSIQQAVKVFSRILVVSQDNLTGYVTVSLEHKSPATAADWVTWLVEDVNTTVKNQEVQEATMSIEYIKQQVEKTSLADLQAMFFELIQSQTETIMLAQVRPEYVFKVIDPAIVPEEKSRPSRATICVIGTVFGNILGIMLVLAWSMIRPYFIKTAL